MGIALALRGGDGWESADDWAALFASLIIGLNGVRFMRLALSELLDRSAPSLVLERLSSAAESIEGVLAIERLRVRKSGVNYIVDLHLQVDPTISIESANVIGGKVKGAIQQALAATADVLVHIEPHVTY